MYLVQLWQAMSAPRRRGLCEFVQHGRSHERMKEVFEVKASHLPRRGEECVIHDEERLGADRLDPLGHSGDIDKLHRRVCGRFDPHAPHSRIHDALDLTRVAQVRKIKGNARAVDTDDSAEEPPSAPVHVVANNHLVRG